MCRTSGNFFRGTLGGCGVGGTYLEWFPRVPTPRVGSISQSRSPLNSRMSIGPNFHLNRFKLIDKGGYFGSVHSIQFLDFWILCMTQLIFGKTILFILYYFRVRSGLVKTISGPSAARPGQAIYRGRVLMLG